MSENTATNSCLLTLRVGSYNILHGADVDLDLSVLADDLRALNLQLVGLQEVDVGTSRVGGIDTVCLLAEAAGYPYHAFSKSMDYRGGGYGNAILSHYPIVDFRVLPLPTDPSIEPRSVGFATVLIGDRHVTFCNTHLSVETDEARAEQFDFLKTQLSSDTSFLLTGDFNTTALDGFVLLGGDRFVNRGQYPTYVGTGSAIDNIVYGSAWSLLESGMQASAGHSDHNLLWAEFYENSEN
jgi:endonuclease/exonuclease/phosphatase family metal-dependent hydrolase